MKKYYAITLIVLVLTSAFALFVTAQANESLSWQEQYWQIYWAVAEPLHQIAAEESAQSYWRENPQAAELSVWPRVALWDINNNGVLELFVYTDHPWRLRTVHLVATITDGELRYSTEWGSSVSYRTHRDTQTGELRLLRHGFPARACEILVDWHDLSFTSQNLYRHEMNDRGRGLIFRYYDSYYIGETLVGGTTYTQYLNQFYGAHRWQDIHIWLMSGRAQSIQFSRATARTEWTPLDITMENGRLEPIEFGWGPEVSQAVVGEDYDEVRASFFARMEQLSNDGSLLVQPIDGLYVATDFMQMPPPQEHSLHWLDVFNDRYPFLLHIIFLPLISLALIIPRLIIRHIRKRKRAENEIYFN